MLFCLVEASDHGPPISAWIPGVPSQKDNYLKSQNITSHGTVLYLQKCFFFPHVSLLLEKFHLFSSITGGFSM
jgi:hypothetical protein